VDEPFGLSAEIRCSKEVISPMGESVIAHIVIGIKVDADGETIVYFVTAIE
jgi:hypothetical protein